MSWCTCLCPGLYPKNSHRSGDPFTTQLSTSAVVFSTLYRTTDDSKSLLNFITSSNMPMKPIAYRISCSSCIWRDVLAHALAHISRTSPGFEGHFPYSTQLSTSAVVFNTLYCTTDDSKTLLNFIISSNMPMKPIAYRHSWSSSIWRDVLASALAYIPRTHTGVVTPLPPNFQPRP